MVDEKILLPKVLFYVPNLFPIPASMSVHHLKAYPSNLSLTVLMQLLPPAPPRTLQVPYSYSIEFIGIVTFKSTHAKMMDSSSFMFVFVLRLFDMVITIIRLKT